MKIDRVTIRELRDDLSVQSPRSDDCGSILYVRLYTGEKRIGDWSRIVSMPWCQHTFAGIVEPHETAVRECRLWNRETVGAKDRSAKSSWTIYIWQMHSTPRIFDPLQRPNQSFASVQRLFAYSEIVTSRYYIIKSRVALKDQ